MFPKVSHKHADNAQNGTGENMEAWRGTQNLIMKTQLTNKSTVNT